MVDDWLEANELVDKINSIVGKNDTFICLGDVGKAEYVNKISPGKPFLKEFVLKPKKFPGLLQRDLDNAGFFAALDTEEGYVSFCVTEQRTKEEIDQLVKIVKEG